MALKLYDTLTPDGDYPLMQAKDVEMPDGTRLSEFKGGGGGSVSWEDVTDKPFYEIEGEKEILAETTITVDVGVGETTAPLIGLTAGAAYRIVWNGTEYTDTAVEATLLGYQAIVVGNTALAGGENSSNYPFLLGDVVGMGYFVAEDKNASSHTVAIYQNTTVIKHLDNKYLDFIEINKGVELLPEQTVTLDNEDNEIFIRLFDTTTIQFATMSAGKVGEVYTVVWQGTEYTCKMSAVDSQVVLGNLSIGNATATDTGEPFLLALAPTEGLIIVCKPDSELDILAETRFATSYISEYGAYGIGFNFTASRPLFPLALGDKCIVVWDGDVYEVTVGDSSAIMPDTLYVGNGSGFGLSGNGEPFAIAWDATGETGVTIFSTVDTEHTEHTIRICQSALEATICIYQNDDHKIKPEYLPDISGIVKPAVEVDLTAFESEGKIVETYADGSTVTTTMERNAEGKITKITDSNGNVTVLTR